MENILRCNVSHVGMLAKLSARAFFNDPLYEYIFPDAATREILAAWELGNIAEYGIRFGEVYATSTLSGCAIWLPPGETDFTEVRMGEVGMLNSPAYFGAESEERLTAFMTESEECHRRVAPHPHWYLVLLGVDPARQGEGIGSALLAAGLAKADASRFPVYLETASPHNVPFYQRRGFEVRLEASLSEGGTHLWYMVRDPMP